jgi:CRP/FNR family cyclic AMP-dependent transcriptional regulator
MNHSFPGNSRKEGSVLSAIIDMMHRMFLFADLNEHELEQIAEAALVRSYRSKSNVFMEGEVRQAVYFINKGVIKVYKVDHHGNEAIMNFLKPGDMFPHAGFFENEPYPGTAEVVLEAELGVVPVKAFENILLSRPEIAIKVMRVMGRKIRIDINFRIAALLVRLAREYGVQGSYGTLIELRTTNMDLARMAGTTRETVNRFINRLKREGVLQDLPRQLVVKDMPSLERYIE